MKNLLLNKLNSDSNKFYGEKLVSVLYSTVLAYGYFNENSSCNFKILLNYYSFAMLL